MKLNGLENWDEEQFESIARNDLKDEYTDKFKNICGDLLYTVILVYENEYLNDSERQDAEGFKDAYDDLFNDYIDNNMYYDEDRREVIDNLLGDGDTFSFYDASKKWREEMRDVASDTYSNFIQNDKKINWRGFERSKFYISNSDEECRSSLKRTLQIVDQVYKKYRNGDLMYTFNNGDDYKVCSGYNAENIKAEDFKNDLTLNDVKDERDFFNVFHYFYSTNCGNIDLAIEDTLDAYRFVGVQDGIEGEQGKEKGLEDDEKDREKFWGKPDNDKIDRIVEHLNRGYLTEDDGKEFRDSKIIINGRIIYEIWARKLNLNKDKNKKVYQEDEDEMEM